MTHQGRGARVGKRDPRDFTLWKGAKPGEPSWPTPWVAAGRAGTPECVAMAHEYLGAEFDIHCGGMDLVFPHHENEIAQARAAGDGFARYWLHNGWVTMGGEKMASKSLGNVLAIPAVLQRFGLPSCVTSPGQRTPSVDAGVLRGALQGCRACLHGSRGIPASGQNADRCG